MYILIVRPSGNGHTFFYAIPESVTFYTEFFVTGKQIKSVVIFVITNSKIMDICGDPACGELDSAIIILWSEEKNVCSV